MIYKSNLARKILEFLNVDSGDISEHLICCRHEPRLEHGTQIINVCAGCDRRYRELYAGISTTSLWEVLAQSSTFPFPNYQGKKILTRMNIVVVEPANTRTQATCCGDSFYGTLPVEQVKDQMKKRAAEMPCEDVVVYCVSCVKSLYIGGKQPRYLVDLLFGEETGIGTWEPEAWHNEVQQCIDAH